MHEVERRHRAFYDTEVTERAARPLEPERRRVVAEFAARLRREGARRVLELGCGVGRDAPVLDGPGVEYLGLDLSTAPALRTRADGHPAVVASATRLPLADSSVDAVWSMSTLMHLPGDGFEAALTEAARVARTGGLMGLGLWGHDRNGEWTDRHGRLFRHRTDARVRDLVERVATVLDLETWSRFEDGGHYQWVLARFT